jgi:hypothetical protein
MTTNPTQLFQQIDAYVRESHALLEQGMVLELEGLDEHVRGLCEGVMQLSQEERLRHGDDLQRLFHALNALGKELERHRDATAAEMRGTTHHRKASHAYRMVEASDHKPEQD